MKNTYLLVAILAIAGCQPRIEIVLPDKPVRLTPDLPPEWAEMVREAAARWDKAAGRKMFIFGPYGVPIKLWTRPDARASVRGVWLPQLGARPSDDEALDLATHELGHLILGPGHDSRPWCIMHEDVGVTICL